MGSVRECFPPLEGNRRRRPLDEYDTGVVPHVGGGDALSDLHTKLAHIQWRKHANNKSIRYEQRCWMSTIDFCIFGVDYCGSCAKRIDDANKLITKIVGEAVSRRVLVHTKHYDTKYMLCAVKHNKRSVATESDFACEKEIVLGGLNRETA